MAANETNEPDRDVEAAAVRALDALTRALDGFTKATAAATNAAEKLTAALEAESKRRER